MPIYEYQCGKCDKITEVLQLRSDDAPPTRCPNCGSKKLRRLVSESAFQLKGGGWYKDLYSSVRPDSKSSEGSSTESKSDKKSDSTSTKSESKEKPAKEKKEPKGKAKASSKD